MAAKLQIKSKGNKNATRTKKMWDLGFEPRLPRPQRGVLTTIRIRLEMSGEGGCLSFDTVDLLLVHILHGVSCEYLVQLY